MKNEMNASSQSDSSVNVSLDGRITEETELPSLNLDGVAEVVIDLEKVSYINSTGVRSWMIWNTKRADEYPSTKVTFSNLPVVLSRQMFAIAGFLPKGAKIASLTAHYYCEECDSTTKILVDTRTFLDGSTTMEEKRASLETTHCKDCGAEAAIEYDAETFCKFIAEQGCKN